MCECCENSDDLPECEGCDCCQSCCNCEATDCDCDSCTERRLWEGNDMPMLMTYAEARAGQHVGSFVGKLWRKLMKVFQ